MYALWIVELSSINKINLKGSNSLWADLIKGWSNLWHRKVLGDRYGYLFWGVKLLHVNDTNELGLWTADCVSGPKGRRRKGIKRKIANRKMRKKANRSWTFWKNKLRAYLTMRSNPQRMMSSLKWVGPQAVSIRSRDSMRKIPWMKTKMSRRTKVRHNTGFRPNIPKKNSIWNFEKAKSLWPEIPLF